MSGTSMAAAVVSGAVADILQGYPNLAPEQVKALLMVNANRACFPASRSVIANGVTYLANYDVFSVGAGSIDLQAALDYLSAAGQE